MTTEASGGNTVTFELPGGDTGATQGASEGPQGTKLAKREGLKFGAKTDFVLRAIRKGVTSTADIKQLALTELGPDVTISDNTISLARAKLRKEVEGAKQERHGKAKSAAKKGGRKPNTTTAITPVAASAAAPAPKRTITLPADLYAAVKAFFMPLVFEHGRGVVEQTAGAALMSIRDEFSKKVA